jgi:hypothetical protein
MGKGKEFSEALGGRKNEPCADAEVRDRDDFPEFMKRAANGIATSSQATPGVEG